MSRETEDGKHEGWIASICTDGAEATASNGTGVFVGPYIDHKQEHRPFSDDTHWQMRCSCGWTGRRYVVDNYPHDKWREPSDELEDSIFGEWYTHIGPSDLLAEIGRTVDQ